MEDPIILRLGTNSVTIWAPQGGGEMELKAVLLVVVLCSRCVYGASLSTVENSDGQNV